MTWPCQPLPWRIPVQCTWRLPATQDVGRKGRGPAQRMEPGSSDGTPDHVVADKHLPPLDPLSFSMGCFCQLPAEPSETPSQCWNLCPVLPRAAIILFGPSVLTLNAIFLGKPLPRNVP